MNSKTIVIAVSDKALKIDKLLLIAAFLKNLVCDGCYIRNPDYVERMTGCLMAVVAGICEQIETGFKHDDIFSGYGMFYTVQCGKYHGQGFDAGAVSTILLDIIQGFLDFLYFKISEVPVFVFTCEPQFGVMHLNGRHKISDAGCISMGHFVPQTVNLILQIPAAIMH